MTDLFCDTGDITVCYRIDGADDAPPLVLLAGLGYDLTSWSQTFVDALVAQGFRVIRPDNRDTGRSTYIAEQEPSPLWRQATNRPLPEGYDLSDMAGDVVGLLDHLGIERAHLVGMSMGGMIAQTVAAAHPERVETLTSIFSTTGAAKVGGIARQALMRMALPTPTTVEEATDRHLGTLDLIGSQTFPHDEEIQRAWIAGLWERSGGGGERYRGTSRQIDAIKRSGDRTEAVRRITAPTLVIHGDADLMVHPSGGQATHEAIAGSRHVTIAGMGHHLAPGLDERLTSLIADHAHGREPAEEVTVPGSGTRKVVAAVTGAGSGIGQALAIDLARRGADLVISDVDAASLEVTRVRAEAQGARVLATVVDVTDRSAVAAWANEAVTHFGVVDQLYNNAGIGSGGRRVLDVDYDDIERSLAVNLWGVIHGTKEFLPHLIASGDGALVNISSLNGILAQPGLGSYCAAKFGVRGFTETVRAEMLADGHPVSVSVVHPGGVRTNIASARLDAARLAGEEVAAEDEARTAFYNEHLLVMTPEEAARIILDGVEARRPRIIVGADARRVDAIVRLAPTWAVRAGVRIERAILRATPKP
ncbi:MAG: SDR family NAD(P)-dependent oxidoreductase [Mobilicoccus sp.]|nr:SDR family NAD(P)-dependent oxidoreductase [Mobilicoccus sp.]